MAITLKTSLVFGAACADPGLHEPDMVIEYTVTPGAPDTWEEPGWDAEVSISSIKVRSGSGFMEEVPGWMFVMFEGDESLRSELLDEAAAEHERGLEYMAEARRDDAMMERGR